MNKQRCMSRNVVKTATLLTATDRALRDANLAHEQAVRLLSMAVRRLTEAEAEYAAAEADYRTALATLHAPRRTR